MKTIVVIQARMGSSRLPGKILMPLGDHDNLYYVTSRCKSIRGVDEVIVATSRLPQDDAVEQWCSKHQIVCCRGSEEDVLSRYMEAARPYQPTYVVRVTADCPFVDVEMAEDMIRLIQQEQVDIVDLGAVLPRGLAVEAISYPALQMIDKHGHEPRHREHVTYYAYEYREQFTRAVYHPPVNRLHPQLRITLDTEEDYALISAVARHFNDPYISSAEVIQYLLDHPELASLNAHVEQKPVV
ncbi:MAG: glycosyltransferase family protein [Paenibacillus macerans]|uniref:cytidylyltransferase domain-containing protein n=1 Tax=Paenibacillus TaxID=44249 RepID=UPI00097A02B5|nr:glycosyltransferase family protein [Paenibacillus macerans]MBS5910778.1 glycosyltransferase family protein [Paenibacillus macerans]MDU5950536.1 glycosyltransferase family protein [Paenibacillus macerans]MDU7475878.1 glycosyltransferase family protein [Paenibacillus macerans]MEC0139328.1 glycosyltransferase family protein [Paenibacillus macerans]MEC0328203.1 glycosyltransferase family protein [Paenibacillus macerans]